MNDLFLILTKIQFNIQIFFISNKNKKTKSNIDHYLFGIIN